MTVPFVFSPTTGISSLKGNHQVTIILCKSGAKFNKAGNDLGPSGVFTNSCQATCAEHVKTRNC